MEVALAPVAASWKRDGVTMSSDMMTDRCGRPQANVLLVNDSGAVFEQAVDCNMESKTGGYIASLLRPVIDEVGPENVVAVCTDGGSNYASAAKKIASTWPHIEHVPCATHVLDLMMEDMGKMGWAKGLVEKRGEMITFVRNHHFTRAYMKKVGGKQVLKPAGTRFGTQYIAMARLCEVRSGLAAMVLSDEWKVWAAADKDRKTAAEKFRAAVMDEEWWGVAEFFTSLMAVPFKAMRATDSSAKGMMGKLYDIMLQLTEDINDKLDASSDFLTRTERADITKIVKDRWDNSLACPMHVVGRILNPANQEEGIFRNDVECTRVFKDYIERHYDNKTFKRGKDGAPRRASLVLQEALLAYINMEGSFGKPGAISAREAVKKGEMSMVQWWSWHSTEYPELAALACRVLTQPVSASPCERGWAQWEGIHTARRNRLGSAKCADLVYIAHNWNVVRNWYKKDGGSTVVLGNIPDAPIPPGYNMDEEEDDMLGEEGEDAVLADEYGEGVVVEKPRKEIGKGINVVFNSAFQSVSAFANAGFGLMDENLIPFQRNVPYLLVMAVLILQEGQQPMVSAVWAVGGEIEAPASAPAGCGRADPGGQHHVRPHAQRRAGAASQDEQEGQQPMVSGLYHSPLSFPLSSLLSIPPLPFRPSGT
ncbi:unnamed protein product [Closterium sp. Naga37s-1]|nr:unnamed protein product [Closterium sp. Naga37s-1]